MHAIRVLADPGHSESPVSSGAVSADKRITEYEMNLFQANILKRELVYDMLVDIVDPTKDDRVAIGMKAKGYDLFVSTHLNAFNKKANYTSVCVDTRHNTPESRSTKLASVCAIEIAKALGLKAYQNASFPPGVMPKHLEVLNYAHRSGCPICILVEPFFIDVYSDRQIIENKCTIAMKTLANVLRKALT